MGRRCSWCTGRAAGTTTGWTSRAASWARGFITSRSPSFGYLSTPLPPDISSAAQARALVCLLDTLGLARVAVLGVSAGAHPTAQLALSHPERVAALALVVSALYVPPEPGEAPATGPPAFVIDYVPRSDFLVWLRGRATIRPEPPGTHNTDARRAEVHRDATSG